MKEATLDTNRKELSGEGVGQAERVTGRDRPRLLGLDILRLLAVALVLGRHMWPPPDTWPDAPRAVLNVWNRGGWIGVDLFFVLSGFLVSGLLFTEYKLRGRLSLARFYIRRGWKIYPPFWALIAATMIVRPVFGIPFAKSELAAELLFVQSYFPRLWNHTWSLAVEEHFYLLLPLALLMVLKLRGRSATPFSAVPKVAAWLAALTLLARVITWYFEPSYTHDTHLIASHLRLDGLFFGVAISYAYHFHTTRFVEALGPWRSGMIVAGTLLLVPAFVFDLDRSPFIFTTVGVTLFYLGSGMLLVGVLLSNLPRSRAVAIAATLGAYSYSIYLWHLPVKVWGVTLIELVAGPLSFTLRATLYLLGSFAAGVVMAKAVEVPTLRLRDRWFPARDRGAIEDQPPSALPHVVLATKG